MNGRIMRGARYLTLAGVAAAVGACSWFTDFKEQPKFDPWESTSDTTPMRGNPQNSVSVYGSAAPGYAVSRERLPGTIDSMSAIPNPTPADARSLENGRKYYQINCAVCHGESGKGFAEAPISKYPGVFAPALNGGSAQARSDGYIWGIMRNGRGLMPSYDRIEELDRWDVVNYVRGLQGRYPVAVGAVGLPGETGDKVPGYSQMGPTRPAPYYIHAGAQAGPTGGTAGPPNLPPGAPSTSPVKSPTDTAHAPAASDTARPASPTTTTPKTGGER
jgi:mono/diheme cytochrome c family protein